MTAPESAAAAIPPQQVLEQLRALRLQNHSMESALQEVADLTKKAMPGASEVSITLTARGRADTAVSTGQLARDLDESQYQRGYGPCLDAALHHRVMHIEDVTTETRWADYTKAAVKHRALSSVSVPITLQEEPSLCAGLNIYSTRSHAFDDADVDTAITLAGHASSMLTNMHAHDSARVLVRQLAAALETRPVIDQAKGILMRDRACTAEEAFDLLVAASQRSNRKLRDVARDVVESVTRPT